MILTATIQEATFLIDVMGLSPSQVLVLPPVFDINKQPAPLNYDMSWNFSKFFEIDFDTLVCHQLFIQYDDYCHIHASIKIAMMKYHIPFFIIRLSDNTRLHE